MTQVSEAKNIVAAQSCAPTVTWPETSSPDYACDQRLPIETGDTENVVSVSGPVSSMLDFKEVGPPSVGLQCHIYMNLSKRGTLIC